MSDLIDRQALLKQIDIDSDGEPGYYGDTWKFIDTIKNMPNVHDLPKDTDTISRQVAIEVIDSFNVFESRSDQIKLEQMIGELPHAQPEIVRCKDCKHFVRDDIEEYAPYGFYNTYFHAFCDKHWDNEQGEFIDVKIDDFCSFAERREVTT